MLLILSTAKLYPFWVWTPLDEYLPVNETAAPKTILSPTTFAKDTVEAEIKSAIAETNVIIIVTQQY